MADSNKDNWIGFDLGGTKMMAVAYGPQFAPLGKKRRKTKAFEGAEAGIERIVKTINDALADAHLKIDTLAGIGMGIPGHLDLKRGVIHSAPNLGWQNVRIKRELEKQLGCPVVIANDVDAGLYGEYCFGAAKKTRCALGVFPGTGIGGACVYEGKIIRGSRNSCMEIGHTQVLPDGPLCGCGQLGCLEAVASRLAISAEAAKAAYRGEAPHLLEVAGTDLSRIRSGVLAASIDAGDKAVEQIVRRAAQWIGLGVANTVNLLSPDVVVLGGGLVEAIPEVFREVVEESAAANVMASFRKTFRVAVAELGDDAAVMGAAAWACEETTGKQPCGQER